MTVFTGWENFYVIVGSSAGALIGLQFVVMTLMADMPIGPGAALAGEAFGTPTIVHFGVVLLLSALISIPWRGTGAAAVLWGLLGLGGIVYEGVVARRMRAQTVYAPESEDWLFHVALPFIAYAILVGSAFAARSDLGRALFAVGAAALLLLFVGIHNAWDAVTYHVFVQRRRDTTEGKRSTEPHS
jgi:hypothetical protein